MKTLLQKNDRDKKSVQIPWYLFFNLSWFIFWQKLIELFELSGSQQCGSSCTHYWSRRYDWGPQPQRRVSRCRAKAKKSKFVCKKGQCKSQVTILSSIVCFLREQFNHKSLESFSTKNLIWFCKTQV